MLHDEPCTDTAASTRIDVDYAVEEFNLFSRRFSIQSQATSQTSDSVDTGKNSVFSHDIEKGDLEDEPTPFNLRAYLTSSNDANQAAGIKHKVWNRPCYYYIF